MTLGPGSIPGAVLLALATRVRLHASEWRLVALVLASPRPLSVHALGKRLGWPYPYARKVARGLLAWQILRRGPVGVVLQPDAERWRAPESR